MVVCVETAELIEMPFQLWATEPRIRWGPDFYRELTIFVGNVSTVHQVGFLSGKSYIECGEQQKKVHWQLHGNLTGDMCPQDAFFYQKFRNFYYLLSRAQSKVLTLISCILYFTLYFLLFVNCSLLPSFFSCVYVRKSVVWCVYSTFFLFFLLPLAFG